MIAPLPREVYALAERWMLTATALGFAPSMTAEWSLVFVAEVLRLRADLACAEHARATAEAALAHEQRNRAVVETELTNAVAIAKQMQAPTCDETNAAALMEALDLLDRVLDRVRPGLVSPLSPAERERLRALRRAVPS